MSESFRTTSKFMILVTRIRSSLHYSSGAERTSDSSGSLATQCSSVVYGFEIRSGACRNNHANFKSTTLVDFTILTFADPSQPPGDANFKINPLAPITHCGDCSKSDGPKPTERQQIVRDAIQSSRIVRSLALRNLTSDRFLSSERRRCIVKRISSPFVM